ncbi:MAG TPA: aminotransferase class V-fold PLP-dependent enzyme, partial [Phycisphaerae bacterium]|nr:aminotransferase class V-fold PLP-dependent enzyme [Phycisphaerae bacterium]
VACQILQNEGAVERTRIAALRTRLEAELRRQFANAHIIGGGAERLPNTTLVCFEGVASEALLMLLSDVGICASGGAACASGSQEPSHVLKAMGVPPPIALGEVRFSLGRFNTDADLDRLFQILPGALRKVAAL